MADIWVGWSRSDAPAPTESLLSPDELIRLRALARPDDRARFLSAHVLVRLLVAGVVGVPATAVVVVQRCARCGRSHGRPMATVDGLPGPEISLAHAGGVVIAAVSDVPVGVDLEPVGGAHPGVDEVALTAGERRQLATMAAVEQPAALMRWWVRKEALLKATGHGLDVEPSRVEITAPDEAPRLLRWDGQGAPPVVELADIDVGDEYAAALAALVQGPLHLVVAELPLSDQQW